jgi:hypothetical protein
MISILYVDDEPTLVQLTALYLERFSDMKVDTALSVIVVSSVLVLVW